MPRPLTIKQPKLPSPVEQAVIGILTVGPLFGLFYLWSKRLDLHFDSPWLNLGVHAALVAIPLIWAGLITCKPLEFEPTEEIVLGTTSFFEKLPMDWWTMFMMWPAAIFAALVLGHDFFTEYLPHPEALSTSPLKALAVVVVTFCFGFFYATILLGRSEPRTLVSQAGLRTGVMRFFEWENIHHLSQRGDLYSIYHRANPAFPATSFRLRDHEAQATLERFLSQQQVPISNVTRASFRGMKFVVVLGFCFNLLVASWLRFNSPLSLLWISLISFGIGMLLTLLVERIRGVPKFSKYKPVIEEPDQGTINA